MGTEGPATEEALLNISSVASRRAGFHRVPGWPASFQLGELRLAVPARTGRWDCGVAASPDPQSSLWLQGMDGLQPGTLPGGSAGPENMSPAVSEAEREWLLEGHGPNGAETQGLDSLQAQGQGLGAWAGDPSGSATTGFHGHTGQGEPTLGSGLSREAWSQLGARTAIPTPGATWRSVCVCM